MAMWPVPVDTLIAIGEAGVLAVESRQAVVAAFVARPASGFATSAARVFGVAVGKAAVPMQAGVREAVGGAWAGGIAVSHDADAAPAGAELYLGEHPLPGPASAVAGRAVLAFLAGAGLTNRDLVVVSVSGGASALMAVPVAGVDVDDLRAVSDVLLRSGAGIEDINAVRRLLSATHNGGLAAAAAPARVLGLLIDDTPGAAPDSIGSGPTFPARDTRARAERAAAIHLTGALRSRVVAAIRRVALPRVGEVCNEVVAGPGQALAACRREAARRGFEFATLPALVCDPSEAAERLAAGLRARAAHGRPVCVAASGEVAVQVPGSGRGGRCQQLAWEMIPHVAGLPGSAFLGLATDGRDHLPGVGGAWVTERSAAAVEALGLSWAEIREDRDTNGALGRLGGLVPERATGTNVADLYLAAVDPQARSSR